MVEITLREAMDVLRQLEDNRDLHMNRRAALIEQQYRIIIRLLVQKAQDHDAALEILFKHYRGMA
jgi:hypothetical protein